MAPPADEPGRHGAKDELNANSLSTQGRQKNGDSIQYSTLGPSGRLNAAKEPNRNKAKA